MSKAPINSMIRNRAGKVLIVHENGDTLWVHSIDGRERMAIKGNKWRFARAGEPKDLPREKSKGNKPKAETPKIIPPAAEDSKPSDDVSLTQPRKGAVRES